ncbi:MAG: hypothetical protein GX631_06125, partial [Dehalococcoidales bacterium]|nr:hypothetical protein [Dehalococcoidales bacterium]
MQADCDLCNRCQMQQEDDVLRDLAYDEDRYLADLVHKAQKEPDSPLAREALKKLDKRMNGEEDEDCEASDGMFKEENTEEGTMPGVPGRNENITEEDVRQVLNDYENRGLVNLRDGKVIVTSNGVKKLAAGALERILRNLNNKIAGSNVKELPELGIELTSRTRRYEAGDDYSLVDIEKTLLNTLDRCGSFELKPDDFEIREEVHRTKLCAGIIIDESGSMRDSGKLKAAMETAIILSRLIQRNPDNILKVYAFSDKVQPLTPWSIVNDVISGGDTDIKGALAAFRRDCRRQYGDKQAYLITDTEPNNEDGRHLSLEKAAGGLLEEAARYRQEKIGLNIIMLDEG